MPRHLYFYYMLTTTINPYQFNPAFLVAFALEFQRSNL